MKNFNVDRMKKGLGLGRNIVGIKFIDFKEDFDELKYEEKNKKGPLCYLVRSAMDGSIFKATKNEVSCDYARYSLGLEKPDTTISEGRSYCYCGLYESNAIAKNIVQSMKYPEHQIYGVAIGPLEKMDDADIVIIVDFAETIMRIMQGYGYKYGNPENLSFFGNQAMCADLTSKPYANNDINISMLCKGTRDCGRFDKGELGVSMPISMFDSVVEGVIETLNVVIYKDEKEQVLKRVNTKDEKDELGITITYGDTYGKRLTKYDNQTKERRLKQEN